MLRNMKGLLGYKIVASDGEIGRVEDFYFDDAAWRVRYLVDHTGGWLRAGKHLLISTEALMPPDWKSRSFPVNLDRKSVQESPEVEKRIPVTRADEERVAKYFGWPLYWGESWGYGAGIFSQSLMARAAMTEREAAEAEEKGPPPKGCEPGLRSLKATEGFRVEAVDGTAGHVADFIASDETWELLFIVVDTRVWLPGHRVLMAAHCAGNVDFGGKRVHVNLSRNEVKTSPEYDPSTPINRDYADGLYDYYGRPRAGKRS